LTEENMEEKRRNEGMASAIEKEADRLPKAEKREKEEEGNALLMS